MAVWNQTSRVAYVREPTEEVFMEAGEGDAKCGQLVFWRGRVLAETSKQFIRQSGVQFPVSGNIEHSQL